MSQNRVTAPLDIYEALVDDTEFMTHVGTYSFVNSISTLPSISISTPNVPIPNLENVTGLEVIIHDVGNVTRFDYLTDETLALVTYQVYLVLWTSREEPGDGSLITNATTRMVKMFSGTRSVLTVPINKTPNVAIQAIVEIPNNALIQV